MSKFERDFGRIERSLRKLGASPRQAAAFRGQVAKGLLELARENEDKIVEHLVNEGRAGWVKDPKKGVAVLVERGTGCVLLDSEGKEFHNPTFTHPRTVPVDKGKFVSHLKRQGVEEYVPYMYLDKNGNVTVGIGHLVVDANEAKRLPFVDIRTNRPAHPLHIENGFNKIKNSGLAGARHTAFKAMTHIVISEADATIIALNDIDQKIREITAQGAFPDYDTYPPAAKLGLLDITYQKGVRGTLRDMPNLVVAIRHRNWTLAAQKSHRALASDERNREVRDWFLRAALAEPFFIDPQCRKSLKLEVR